jgi:hypothetical protein
LKKTYDDHVKWVPAWRSDAGLTYSHHKNPIQDVTKNHTADSGPVASYCEHRNEPSNSYNLEVFLDYVSDYLLKEVSAPRIWLQQNRKLLLV